MIFKDLLLKINIEDVLSYLYNNYENEIRFDSDYRNLYNKLINMSTEEHSLKLFVVKQQDIFEDNYSMCMLGYSKEEKQHYAIDFVPWSKILGMEIIEKSLSTYGDVCFVATCLREMTFISFDERRIQAEYEELERRAEMLEHGVEKTYSAEEVFEHLREEFGFEETDDEDIEIKSNEEILEMVNYNNKLIEELVN